MDIRLPSGKVVTNIPEGTSKDDIRLKLISSGAATEDDFVQPKQADVRSIVSSKETVEGFGSEDVERNKTMMALQQKGYDVTPDTVEFYKNKLFGRDSSWGAVNRELANQLSVQSLGPVKKIPKTGGAWRLVPSSTVRYTYAGIAGMAGVAQNLILNLGYGGSKYQAEKSFAYDLMGEWRKNIKQRSSELEQIWDGNVPENVKTSLGGNILSGIGQLLTLPMYAVPGVGPATTIGQVYDEALEESGGDHNIAGAYTVASAPLEVASDLLTMKAGKLLSGTTKGVKKPLIKKAVQTVIAGQMAGAGEGATEAVQSATLQKMVKGEIDPKQVAVESFVGYIVGTVGGTGSSVSGAVDVDSRKKRLIDVGISEQTADALINGGINEENRPAIETAVEEMVAFEGKDIETKEITSHNGGPLTTDDIVTLREQPELIESLDDSEASQNLKKAVNEGDMSALAEVNQGIVGVEEVTEEVQDAIQIGETTQVPLGETSRDGETLDGEIRLKSPEEAKAEIDSFVKDVESDTPIREVSEKAQKILDIGSGINAVISKAASLSTRVTEISPVIGRKFRGVFADTHEYMSDGTTRTTEFVNSYNAVAKNSTPEQINELKYMLRTGDFDGLRAKGITGIDQLRAFLDERGNRLELPMVENYFPTRVKDYKGLAKSLGYDPKGIFKSQMDAKAKKLGRELTQEERRTVIRQALREGDGSMGYKKSRVLESLTPEMMQYYDDPIRVLEDYNMKTARAIATAEFTGTLPKVVDGDFDYSAGIDEVIASAVESGEMDFDKQKQLKELVQAGLNYKQGYKAVSAYRRLVSLKYVTKLKTSVAQYGDIGANIGENSIRSVLGVDAEPFVDAMNEEIKTTLESVNVNKLDMEIQETKKTQIEDALFRPLQAPDAQNKVWLLNASFNEWKSIAKKNPAKLEELLVQKWGDKQFAKDVTADIVANKFTRNVKMAGYMQIADFHPVSPAEHLKVYVSNPAIRPFFVLKSFGLKRFDRLYREGIRDMVSGNAEVLAGAADKNMDMVRSGGRKIAHSSVALAKFAFWSVGVESTLEWAWNEAIKALGFKEDKEDDRWIDYYLQNLGRIIPFIDAYDIEQAVERKDPFVAVKGSFELAEPIGSDIVQSAVKLLYADEKAEDQIDWMKDIPYLNEFMYNKAKAEKDKKKKGGKSLEAELLGL